MSRKRLSAWVASAVVAAAAIVGFQAYVAAQQDDAVVARIVQLGTSDNQVMTWNDYASNRFGGRETGTNAYTDATEWAAWQFKQWGFDVALEEAGEVPVGFNRGPWFGRIVKPAEKALHFGTPSFTAGTRGVQRGGVVLLKADPFSIPGRNAKPEDVEKKRAAVQQAIAEVNANKAAFKDKWVLIAGASSGFGRDGRRATPEYSDSQLIPLLTKALVDAGALGTIQAAKPTAPAHNVEHPPISILDGHVTSWDKLPVLPDIKLLDAQYNDIKAMVEKNQPIELEFDIRNWFKMGPIRYHNVVATIRGSQYPDEYVVIGGHYDCFSGGTGGVDDGSGFAPGMEAVRLIKAAGGRPKRSIVFILFAAEESGLVGSQAWLKRHPELAPKIVMMINRDYAPAAITGVSVPETWYADLAKVTAPLAALNPKWPFKLEKALPRAHATSPGGTDSSSFEMASVPTLNFANTREYNYPYAWHTTNDLYSELVPFTEQQQHSALVTAVVAYGVANLEKPLTRAGVYLPDGMYAAVTTSAGQFMATIDFAHAPLHAANFIRITEGKTPPAGAGRGGPMGPGGPGAARADLPPIGKLLLVKGNVATGQIVSDVQKASAVQKLPKLLNAAVKHDAPGVFGMIAPNSFYITLGKNPGFDRRYTALGRVIAGADVIAKLKKDDTITSVRIVRVGQAARDFKADDEAFKKLLGEKK